MPPLTPMPVARAQVVAVGTALPERRVSNAELACRLDTTDEWIVSRTGISSGVVTTTCDVFALPPGSPVSRSEPMVGGSLGGVFSSNAQEVKGVIFGLVIILFLRFAPSGLVGAFRRLGAAIRRWPLAY